MIILLLHFKYFILLRMVHRTKVWLVTHWPINLMCLTNFSQTNVSLHSSLTFSLPTLVPSTKGNVGGDAERLTWLNDLRRSDVTRGIDVPVIKNEKISYEYISRYFWSLHFIVCQVDGSRVYAFKVWDLYLNFNKYRS